VGKTDKKKHDLGALSQGARKGPSVLGMSLGTVALLSGGSCFLLDDRFGGSGPSARGLGPAAVRWDFLLRGSSTCNGDPEEGRMRFAERSREERCQAGVEKLFC